MNTERKQEKDFQTQANEYASRALESIADMVHAMEHAAECKGTVECDKCAGTGEDETQQVEDKTCLLCKGTGEIPCPEGKDSDDPESWHDEERARQRIQDDALSVEVRSDWHTLGEPGEPSEYNILLTTGGPAARIVGDLGPYNQPGSARFEYQDWFKPWTPAETTREQDEIMLTYAQQFYFGE